MSKVWRAALSEGNIYYYNSVTSEVTWTQPMASEMEDPPAMPEGEPPPEAILEVPIPPPAILGAAPPGLPPPFVAPPPGPPGMMPAPPVLAQPPVFQPVLAPPPKPPPMLHPQQLEPPPLPPQPGQEEFYRRADNWPGRSYHKSLGEQIHRFQETPGNVRCDVIIETRVIGRLLGKGARDFEAMKAYSGAEIFIISKHPPPDEGEDHRLVILIGWPNNVRAAKQKVDEVLERARRELPPLPPPLSSGWRPIPEVGNPEKWDDGQRNGGNNQQDFYDSRQHGGRPDGPRYGGPGYGGGDPYAKRQRA